MFFFFSSRRRHTRCSRDWSSDVCSSDLLEELPRPDSHQLGGLFEQALGGGKRNGDLPSQLFFEEFTRSLCFRARERLGGGHSFPPVRSPSAECPGVRCFGEVYRSSVILLKRFDRVAGTWSY